MGSSDGPPDEQPVHKVVIPKEFEMSKYEVTQAQWDAVMRNPHATVSSRNRAADTYANPSHFKGAARPVESVSWHSVQVFLNNLNQRDPEHTYRLPTEAEWEYAARAGVKEENVADTGEQAWYAANSAEATHPVGEKEPNAWGLYDMYGNVFEWVQDWYSPGGYSAAPPPPAHRYLHRIL